MIVSRRKLIRMFQVPGLIVMPIVFALGGDARVCSWLYVGMFLAGFFTVGAVQFLGELSAARLSRCTCAGTGESFAANIGGRLIGTSFAWVTATLAVTPDRAYAPTKVALVAAARRLLASISSDSSPASSCRSLLTRKVFDVNFQGPIPTSKLIQTGRLEVGGWNLEVDMSQNGVSASRMNVVRPVSAASSLNSHTPIPAAPCM